MTNIDIAAPDVGDAAIARVEELLERGMLADGPPVRQFEDEFARYCESSHAVATSNGTTALHAALEALGVEDGDAVITPSFSFVASANAIRLAGANPVFADIDAATYTIDPGHVEELCRERDDIVGILPVHLYGLPADMHALMDVADAYDLFVLEDACQAHGAKIDGTRIGSFGDAACFSFYPTKNMTTGEGGIVTTDSDDIAAKTRQIVNHGRSPVDDDRGYEHATLGHNFRMTSIGAAIGRAQLERLPEFNRARRENAAVYTDQFETVDVETPVEPAGHRHVYHQYTIRTDDREGLQAALADANIGSAVYYPRPIHRQPAFESVSAAAVSLPQTDRAAETVLSIPVHPALSSAERQRVIQTIMTYVDSNQ